MTDSTPSSFKTLLLDSDAVARKLTRIALQIREANFDETRILLAGVKNRGLELAHRLQAELAKLAPELEVVVDDVAHSGKTMLYAFKPFMQTVPRKLQCAVLVDRSHKEIGRAHV